MGGQNQRKLNWLQVHIPEGLLVDAAWLQRHGYSSALRAKYAANGWLEQVARGVYRRPSVKLAGADDARVLRWQYAVISLQMLLDFPFIAGGRTALELQGFAHYLTTATREVHLYGTKKPPGWTSKLPLDARLVFHNAEKLFTSTAAAAAQNIGGAATQGAAGAALPGGLVRQSWGHWEWPLVLSSPERAILELLDEVPQSETFHQADMLMEGLRNLSPRRLQALLSDCRNVKVKRLFLWFAERHNQPWLKAMDLKDIDLGKGKRMLVRGGKLDKKYNITVPENIDGGG
jgi:hypothetical protein